MDIIARIVGMVLRRRPQLAAAVAAMAGSAAVYLYLPRQFGKAIDQVAALAAGEDLVRSTIIITAATIFGLALLRGLISFGMSYAAEVLSQRVAYDLRNQFYDHVQRLSFAFHDRHHTGDLIARAVTDVEGIRVFIMFGLLRGPYFITLYLVTLGILLWIDWRLGLTVMGFTPILLAYVISTRVKIRRIWMGIQKKMGELTTVLQENLTGMRVVKAFASEPFEVAKFEPKNQSVAEESVRATRVRASTTSVMVVAFMGITAIILGYGGFLVTRGELTIGELSQFLFYTEGLMLPVSMSGWLVNSYARAMSSGQRMFEILDTRSPVAEKSDARTMPPARGHVVFENVSFAYSESQPALSGVSFEARPGQVVALLGAPGSGKSTIVGLIPRFYDVTSGRITIDGMDVRDATLDSLRRNTGIVQQDVFLFSAPIRENIAYGRSGASMDEIVAASKAAQLHEFISGLPGGYGTWVGERGVNFSGGQRQRVAIARALLMDPPILILDDSLSSVDAETEMGLLAALETAMKGRTTFVIAHRLSTVRRADLALVLENGRIAERGTHMELLAKGGLYREIYDLQLRPQELGLPDVQANGHVTTDEQARLGRGR
ncbi:MAG: ABC transporter ATP-binding protein [SAR202 cluster bacterium]|nr:ABC transporter ATP-binding protein [SAR202 cluster bacterium]